MLNSSIRPIDRTLSGATTSSQSRLGSNGNEGVLHIPQSSGITGALPSDCLLTYTGHLLEGGSYSSTEIQTVYSTAPANWVDTRMSLTRYKFSNILVHASLWHICHATEEVQIRGKWIKFQEDCFEED